MIFKIHVGVLKYALSHWLMHAFNSASLNGMAITMKMFSVLYFSAKKRRSFVSVRGFNVQAGWAFFGFFFASQQNNKNKRKFIFDEHLMIVFRQHHLSQAYFQA